MKNIDISIDEQGVAILFLNRPDLLNALNTELMGEGLLALEELAADERVTSLIITGRGRGFCAGADLGSVGDLASPGASNIQCLPDAFIIIQTVKNKLCYLLACDRPGKFSGRLCA